MYDQIVAMLREHNTIPSFMSGGKNDITKELAYKDGKYSITLTDSNGVLSDYSFSSSDSNVSVSKSGNKLTISSTVAISGSVRITAKRNNVPTVSSSAKLIAYGDPNLQDCYECQSANCDICYRAEFADEHDKDMYHTVTNKKECDFD